MKYTFKDPPAKVPMAKTSTGKVKNSSKISICNWSSDSNYIASKNDIMPGAVWVWNSTTSSLRAVLIHQNEVKSIVWNPLMMYLVCCTGTNRIFLWSPEGASVCDLPQENKDLKVMKIIWNPDGRNMVLIDRNQLLVAYPILN